MNDDYMIDDDLSDLLVKQQSLAQRIDEEGLAIFNSLLPRTDTLSVTFNKQSDNDFGIDGELQVLAKTLNTGEKYKVQLKSSGSVKYIKAGTIISFSLDVRSAHSLINIEKVPTALIVIDTKTSRAFWLAIQIDDTVTNSLSVALTKKSSLARKKKLNASAKKRLLDDTNITIHIPTEQEINPNTFEPLREALKQSVVAIAKREVIATKEKSLVTGMKHLAEINRQILELEGFDIIHRSANSPSSPHSIMSIGLDGKTTADLIPNQNYKTSLAPVITLKATFNTKDREEAKLADKFNNFFKGKTSEITLNAKNISSFTAISGSTLIDSIASKDGVKITMSPYIEKRKQKMILSNGTDELVLDAEAWHQNHIMYIEGNDTDPVKIGLEMVPKTGSENPDGSTELKVTFKIKVVSKNFKSTSNQLRILSFFRQSSEISLSFIGPDGFRNKLIEKYSLSEEIKAPDDVYDFAVMLAELEIKLGKPIKYPLPAVITKKMADEARIAHAVLHEGYNATNVSLKIKLEDEKLALVELEKSPYARLSFREAKFNILGQKFVLDGYEKIIQGKVSSVERLQESKFTHKLTLETSTMSVVPVETT